MIAELAAVAMTKAAAAPTTPYSSDKGASAAKKKTLATIRRLQGIAGAAQRIEHRHQRES